MVRHLVAGSRELVRGLTHSARMLKFTSGKFRAMFAEKASFSAEDGRLHKVLEEVIAKAVN